MPPRRLLRTLLLAVLALAAFASSAQAASVSLSVPGDVVEDMSTSIYASGTITSGQTLFVDIAPGADPCGSTEASNSGSRILYSPYYATGSYSTSTSYTPPDAAMYTLCAYVATSAGATPAATQQYSFAARRATATMTLGISADPTEDRSMTVTTSGTMEVGRTVFLDVAPGDVSCASTEAANSGSRILYSPNYASGSYNTYGTYTPADAGTYTVCGWVAASSSAPADGVARTTFTVRRTTATMTLGVADGAMEGRSVAVTVSGTMEVGRTVFVDLAPGDVPCASTEAANSGSRILYSPNYASGSFNTSGTGTPTRAGAQTLCGWVAASSSAPADATARVVFQAAVDPSRPVTTTTGGGGSSGSTYDPYNNGGSTSSTTSLTAPLLLAPDDAASGEQLNPTFKWTLDPRYGATYDRLRVQRVEKDGSTTQLADITQRTATSYVDEDQHPVAKGIRLDLADVAKVGKDATSMSVTLTNGLPPGTYSWFVLRSYGGGDSEDPGEAIASASRRFTVLGPAVTKLVARKRSKVLRTSGQPGYTVVSAATNPFARIRYEIRHQGRTSALFSQADRDGVASITVNWSCEHAGGTYRVTVVASDQQGHQRSAAVSFAPASKARCATLRRAEARAERIAERKAAARQRAADRRYARRQAALERRARAEQAARERRFKHNCRAIGGTPAVVDLDDGEYIVCRSPLGGTLYVPGFD